MIFSSVLFVVFIITCSTTPTSLNHLPPEIVVHHAAQLVEGHHDPVTSHELSRFRTYAQYAGAAYCDHVSEGGPMFCNGDICPSKNATYSDKILEDLRGFIAVDHTLQEMVIAFRGSVGWDWWDNLWNSSPEPWETMRCPGHCTVHSGFANTEAKVNDEITREVKKLLNEYPRYNITVVGHSRGGALAIILAARLRMDLQMNVTTYTYGAPRVGNGAFAKFVSEQGDRNYRITHFNDLVPVVPSFGWPWYFRHVEPEYWLRQGPYWRVDYKPSDLDECHDWTEKHCLEGSIGYGLGILTNRRSHGYYLAAIGQCGIPGGSVWAADELSWNTTEDEEFMASVRHSLAKDIEYAASLHNNSLLAEYRWTGWTNKESTQGLAHQTWMK